MIMINIEYLKELTHVVSKYIRKVVTDRFEVGLLTGIFQEKVDTLEKLIELNNENTLEEFYKDFKGFCIFYEIPFTKE